MIIHLSLVFRFGMVFDALQES